MISLASSTTIVSPSQTSIDKLGNASQHSSSSSVNLLDDEENVTITASTSLTKRQKSQDDLQTLAISSHMTELAFSISDIQTRIFAIQELRHMAQSPNGTDSAGTSATIDESLMNLDERLEAVSKGIKTVSDTLQNGSASKDSALSRKHAALVEDWEAVQEESNVLREELKEDKWLTVFRTVTDQADGMMSSLEKAVNRCQEFIFQVHRRGADDIFLSRSTSQSSLSPSREKGPPNIDTFNTLLESFEAKKKHYMPATSKVLSIIDKGVQDRVTKNGETLRRHAESAQRWKNLRDRIARTDADMEGIRRLLLNDTFSDTGSSLSGTSGKIRGDDSRARAPSTSSTISRSISPLRKFARKLTGSTRNLPPVTPLAISKNGGRSVPSSEPAPSRRQRTSVFEALRPHQPPSPITPDRPGHKYSHSLTPEASPRGASRAGVRTPSGAQKARPSWNSSTKVEPEDRGTIKATPPRRPPSSVGRYSQTDPSRRSISRISMASSRPWSPVSSSIGTSNSSHPPPPVFRPPSRAQTPSNQMSPPHLTPRRRPRTPSHIPAPAKSLFTSPKSDNNLDDDMNLSHNSGSPGRTPGGSVPRPPSRSMIPVPSFQFSSASRPSSAMSQNTDYFHSNALRAQTPEVTIRAKVAQLPIYTPSRNTIKLPPSSYKENSPISNRAPSRAYSRAGAYTPGGGDQYPMHEYIPGNLKDPLDVEIALIVNSIPHGLFIERVDPPLRTVPRDGEEIRAQYAFSNSLARKVVTCRLTTLARPGRSDPTKKVMCRVGGGWQDLQFYILNRQGGL